MQSVLLIQDQLPINAAIGDALGQCYVVHSALDSTQARKMAQAGQLMILAIADIHAHERLYLLRELVVLEYKVVVLLPGNSAALIRACVALGAHGIVEHHCEMDVLLFKIEAVFNGQRTYPAAFLSESLAFYIENLPSLPRSSMAVLNVVLHHPMMKNGEVGSAVRLSVGRVRNIFSTLFVKFSEQNRVDLVNTAIKHGYFVGLHLVFPRGLNVRTSDIKIINGKNKYKIAL